MAEMIHQLQAVVDAYASLAGVELATVGTAGHYRQIKVMGWPDSVHYEFFCATKASKVGVELHVENDAFMGLRDVLAQAVADLKHTQPGMTLRTWQTTRCRIRIEVPGGDSAAVALAMKRLIADTRNRIGEWLKTRTAGPSRAGGTAPALNTILYGPPGTGKTHATIDRALTILDPAHAAAHGADRSKLKERFDALVKDGRIEFVTFHQSFSYEDFVEGLRAETDESSEQLRYKVEDGVFKRMCLKADGPPVRSVDSLGIAKQPRIWKISIDGTGPSKTRDHCLAHGEARIGWGEVGDLQKVNLDKVDLGNNDRSSLRNFSEDVEIGDLLLCIRSSSEILAVGAVQSAYIYDPQPPPGVRPDYANVLKVRWLCKDLAFPILELNGSKQLTLKTVYALSRFTWTELFAAMARAGIEIGNAQVAEAEPQPHVLIIDEINRGNVSRVFGELITLLEPTKRTPGEEALQVVLPYSKKPLSVPRNLYLIGTMNTADRSLAQLDIALRRRFEFEYMPPRPELLAGVKVEGVPVDHMLKVMNERIAALFDEDHCLGHAYFLPLKGEPTLGRLSHIFRRQILPLLQEYFFEDWQKIAWVLNDHRKAPSCRFVVKSDRDAAALFGLEAAQLTACRWALNAEAFDRKESYSGILAAVGVHSDPVAATLAVPA